MLTSMIKRVDVVAYNASLATKNGTWKPGTLDLGLKEDGVGAAMDEFNKDLVTDEMRTRLDTIKADIISEKIKVVDYMTNNKCE